MQTAQPGGTASTGPDVVAGVRLTSVIGRGASGTVWAGQEEAGGERVAVKLLDGPMAAEAEARLLTGVQHPHVLRLRRLSTNPAALVMDLAEGGSVASLVRARGLLEPGEVVTVLAPVADALAALHAAGIVHGDVTAANVLLGRDGRPLLADLGAGRLLGSGDVAATPGYVAPEVLAGADPGPASDVHGLAAVGWFALTGAAPAAVGDRLPLVLLAPDCPDALVQLLTRAVSPDPAERPGLAELASALHASARPRPVRLVAAAMPALAAGEAVTHRIRSRALEDAAHEPTARRRLRLSRRGRRRSRTVAAGATPGNRLRRVVRGAGVVLTAAGLSAGLTALVVVWLPQPGSAPSVAAVRAAVPAPTVTSQEPMLSAVVELVAAREGALRSGDPDTLDRVHAPGSPARRADDTLLARGPVPVRYEVLAVRGAHGDASDGEATAGEESTVVVDLRTRVGGSPAFEEQVRLQLVEVSGRWRVHDVEPVG